MISEDQKLLEDLESLKEKYKMISEDQKLLEDLESLLEQIKGYRPEERSELSRRYAIVITEFEKVVAYFDRYIVRGEL